MRNRITAGRLLNSPAVKTTASFHLPNAGESPAGPSFRYADADSLLLSSFFSKLHEERPLSLSSGHTQLVRADYI